VLCKEFVIDEAQLDAATAHGADAVLLIVRCLDDAALTTLMRGCEARRLTPLVEVHTQAEARRALDAGATLIGVNARDLDTLVIDVAGACRVLAELPPEITRVHLSGLGTSAQVEQVAAGPADAALIGEALMRQDDPRELLAQLQNGARRARSRT
jgi:indole-3-glycerol phosphate synthase